jgi:hypothetical protein
MAMTIYISINTYTHSHHISAINRIQYVMLKWQGVSYIISAQLTFHIAAITMIVEFPTDKLYVYILS